MQHAVKRRYQPFIITAGYLIFEGGLLAVIHRPHGLVIAGVVIPPLIAILAYLLVTAYVLFVLLRLQQRRQLHAEEALVEERHLLQYLMDHIPDQIFFKDLRGRFLRASKAQARLFGLADPAQLIGKTDADFYPEKRATAYQLDEEEILRTGQPLVNKQEQQELPDGSTAWLLTTKLPLCDSQGTIIGTFGVSRNISSVKQSEEQQRTLAEGLQTVLEITDELLTAPTLDDLLRWAVELARTQLGVERCRISLRDREGVSLHGSYGTDLHGETTDEHERLHAMVDVARVLHEQVSRGKFRWCFIDAGVSDWDGTRAAVVGKDVVAMTPILSGDEWVGVFYNDNAISGKAYAPVLQDVLALYCSLLGNIIKRKQAEESLHACTHCNLRGDHLAAPMRENTPGQTQQSA